MVKNLLAMQETWVQFQGWKDPLEEGMATRSSILIWRIPMDRETLTSWGANPCYFLLLTCVGFFVEWGGSQVLTVIGRAELSGHWPEREHAAPNSPFPLCSLFGNS